MPFNGLRAFETPIECEDDTFPGDEAKTGMTTIYVRASQQSNNRTRPAIKLAIRQAHMERETVFDDSVKNHALSSGANQELNGEAGLVVKLEDEQANMERRLLLATRRRRSNERFACWPKSSSRLKCARLLVAMSMTRWPGRKIFRNCLCQ